jgi:hypothetical protein
MLIALSMANHTNESETIPLDVFFTVIIYTGPKKGVLILWTWKHVLVKLLEINRLRYVLKLLHTKGMYLKAFIFHRTLRVMGKPVLE